MSCVILRTECGVASFPLSVRDSRFNEDRTFSEIIDNTFLQNSLLILCDPAYVRQILDEIFDHSNGIAYHLSS